MWLGVVLSLLVVAVIATVLFVLRRKRSTKYVMMRIMIKLLMMNW